MPRPQTIDVLRGQLREAAPQMTSRQVYKATLSLLDFAVEQQRLKGPRLVESMHASLSVGLGALLDSQDAGNTENPHFTHVYTELANRQAALQQMLFTTPEGKPPVNSDPAPNTGMYL